MVFPIFHFCDLCAHKFLCTDLESFPVAGIQEHPGGVLFSHPFWLPIACSLPEFWFRSRYEPEASCPLQTGRQHFPAGHPSRSVLPGEGREMQCPVTAHCGPCTLGQLLGLNSAFCYLEVTALGWAELAWGRTVLDSEQVTSQYRLIWNIHCVLFFSMKFSF